MGTLDLSAGLLQPHCSPGVDLLCVDGDGLAYYCAGKDGTAPEQAYAWVKEMVTAFAEMTRPKNVLILLTAEASPKGGRYAVATVKPYQGQRKNSRRPENWAALRRYLEAGRAGDVHLATHAEADDLFAYHSHKWGGNIAIASQDKDMRMIPGLHVTWDRQRLFWVRPGESPLHAGKQYGQRWFWEQMLSGDTADNIPGLPLLYGKKCGEVGAREFVDKSYNEDIPGGRAHGGTILQSVRAAYNYLYGPEGLDRFVEQACLLWMRRIPADPLDMAKPGGPLADASASLADALERLYRRAIGDE